MGLCEGAKVICSKNIQNNLQLEFKYSFSSESELSPGWQ
jgi:hypothetical protein